MRFEESELTAALSRRYQELLDKELKKGRTKAEAIKKAAHPSFYADTFFVPPAARWEHTMPDRVESHSEAHLDELPKDRKVDPGRGGSFAGSGADCVAIGGELTGVGLGPIKSGTFHTGEGLVIDDHDPGWGPYDEVRGAGKNGTGCRP